MKPLPEQVCDRPGKRTTSSPARIPDTQVTLPWREGEKIAEQISGRGMGDSTRRGCAQNRSCEAPARAADHCRKSIVVLAPPQTTRRPALPSPATSRSLYRRFLLLGREARHRARRRPALFRRNCCVRSCTHPMARAAGIQVLRFPNADVVKDKDMVLERIYLAIRGRRRTPPRTALGSSTLPQGRLCRT